MSEVKLILTADGSHSLLNTALDETYHSRHGAVQESAHVFIRHGLTYAWEQNPAAQQLKVFELGFGTGLNAWLALQFAKQQNLSVTYTTVESYPLTAAVWQQLNYVSASSRTDFDALHQATWNQSAVINRHLTLRKLNQDWDKTELESDFYDVCFFDAFAPNKQPELWSRASLQKAANALTAGGVFVTYCAQGQLKRNLRALGLKVETLAGPPGKREMVRAIKP